MNEATTSEGRSGRGLFADRIELAGRLHNMTQATLDWHSSRLEAIEKEIQELKNLRRMNDRAVVRVARQLLRFSGFGRRVLGWVGFQRGQS